MRKGRPLAPVFHIPRGSSQLVAWSKRPKTAQALAIALALVLLAGEGV